MRWLAFIVLAGTTHAASIDPSVANRAATGADTDFLIILNEQADLSGAAALTTKEEKGWYVYTMLNEVAQRTQKPVLAELKKLGAGGQSLWIANMIAVRAKQNVINAMAARGDVAKIAANPSVSRPALPIVNQLAPPNAITAIEWGVAKVHAPDVWALGYTGQTVVVAGQDTGYQWDHPALVGKYRGVTGGVTNHNYNWHDAIYSNHFNNTGTNPCGYDLAVPCDDESHGTHTMGTMIGDDGAGNQIGVAPGAKWIGCRNMERGYGTSATYAECFQWLIAPTDLTGNNPNPALAPDVINNSWGCPPPPIEDCADVNVLKTVVEAVRAAGIVPVVSAGNAGSGCGSVNDPAAIYDASFTVGATQSDDTIASFSSRGAVTVDGSNRLKPDISAPGFSVRSANTNNAYSTKSGTSMAGPHIAGIVALVISAHPTLRGQVDKIERLIELTAVPRTNGVTCGGVPGTSVPNNTYGWGRADALAALALGDADSDEMPDWWEITESLNHTNGADAAMDQDGDGFTNLQEFSAGTDPHLQLSALRITSVTESGAVAFTSVTNKLYRLESSTTLASNDWFTVTNNIPGTGAMLTVTDPGVTTNAAVFYRIRLLP